MSVGWATGDTGAFKGALRGWEAGEESAFDHLGGFSLRPWDRMENLPLKAVGTQREALEDVLKSVSPDSLAQAAKLWPQPG